MKKQQHAFTLIELLVVVAIITLLIAILLPSLGRAREQAKSIKCAATLRQLGQTMMLYVSEYDGNIVVNVDTVYSVVWSDRIKGLYYKHNRDNGGAAWNTDRPWEPLACPNSTQVVLAGGSSDFIKNLNTGESTPKGYIKWARIQDPANVFWLADGTRDSTRTLCGRDMWANQTNISPYGGIVGRHLDGTSNMIWVDGHGSPVRPANPKEVPTNGTRKPWIID